MTRAYEQQSPASDSDRPVSAIVADVWEKAETLLRQEKRLAFAEAEEKVDELKGELDVKLGKLRRELTAKALGGVIAGAGLFSIVASIVLLLAEAMAPWLAALIVGLALGIAGALLLARAMRLPAAPDPKKLMPTRTIENLKQDARAITEATK